MLSIFYVLGDTYANISIYAKITGSMEKKKTIKNIKHIILHRNALLSQLQLHPYL